MNIPRWLMPWRKMTDLNTVTPIGSALRTPSMFGWIVEAFGGAWGANVAVESTQNLMGFSAVFACIQLIAADVSKMRARLMRMAGDGIWDEVTDRKSPFLSVLRKPNRFQTRIQFLSYWITSKLMYGNAYILLERDNRGGDNRGVVRAMYPLDPRGVKPLVATDGSVYYQMTRNDLAGVEGNPDITVPASEIIHDRMATLWHSLVGVSPLYACGASATQGIRIQANSAQFFGNMSRPSGQLTAPGKIDDETAKRLKAEFESGFGGDKLGRVFVSGNDLKFEAFTMPAEQAQLVEQQKWTVEDVARAFGMPLYKIQAGANPTFNNAFALNLDYFVSTLQTHVEAIELLIDEALGLPDQDLCVKLDTTVLLRMDPLTRADVQEKRVRAGTMKPDEARAEENLHPVAGGDTPYMQQQNFSLAALAKRDALPNPFVIDRPTANPTPSDTGPASTADPVKTLEDWIAGLSAAQLHELEAEITEVRACPE